jgi:DDE family transposase
LVRPPRAATNSPTTTAGLLLHAIVHPAGIQDRDGGILLLAMMFGLHPFLKKLFADAAYQGPGWLSTTTRDWITRQRSREVR